MADELRGALRLRGGRRSSGRAVTRLIILLPTPVPIGLRVPPFSLPDAITGSLAGIGASSWIEPTAAKFTSSAPDLKQIAEDRSICADRHPHARRGPGRVSTQLLDAATGTVA
jgi:hypothetical protein